MRTFVAELAVLLHCACRMESVGVVSPRHVDVDGANGAQRKRPTGSEVREVTERYPSQSRQLQAWRPVPGVDDLSCVAFGGTKDASWYESCTLQLPHVNAKTCQNVMSM
jgi:hypothetical protein